MDKQRNFRILIIIAIIIILLTTLSSATKNYDMEEALKKCKEFGCGAGGVDCN